MLLFLIILPGAVHILDLMTDQIAEHQLPAVSIRNPNSKIQN
jgi:hypothetical protein